MHHFFGSFTDLFAPITDPRQPALITYPLAAFLLAGLWLFVCHLGRGGKSITCYVAIRPAAQIRDVVRRATMSTRRYPRAAFSRLNPAELQAVVTGMTETLIRRKVLYATRLLDHYYLVAIDGTGVLVFPERHCAHCLTRTHTG